MRAIRSVAALAVWALVGGLICGVTASRSHASTTVYQPNITMHWAPASGPVAGYAVYVAWNGGRFPSTPSFTVAGTKASLMLKAGNSVQIRVAAYDAAMNYGARSSASATIRYAGTTGVAGGGAAAAAPGLLWRPSGVGRIEVTLLASGAMSTIPVGSASVEAGGDFDGNGSSDLLLREATGGLTILWMQDLTITGQQKLGSSDPACGVVAVGTFDAGASDDLVWRCDDGRTWLWLMGRPGIVNAALLGTVDPSWVISSAHDFDGDGRADLLWNNATSQTGGWWLMVGTSVAAIVSIPNATSPWVLEGAADVDGDGSQDLLWRSQASGALGLWMMKGPEIRSAVALPDPPGPGFQVYELRDVDGDGQDDIIWYEPDANRYRLWLMSGSRVRAETEF